MKKKKPRGKSLRWVVMMLMLTVALLGWCSAAASYATDIKGLRPPRIRGAIGIFVIGGVRFLWNGIVQVPNAHRVIGHTLTRHPGMLVTLAVLEGGVWVFGAWAARLERQFAKEDRAFRRHVEGN